MVTCESIAVSDQTVKYKGAHYTVTTTPITHRIVVLSPV